MQPKRISLALLTFIVSSSVFAQGNQGTGYLFLTPGAQSVGSRFVTYVNAVNNLNLVLDGNGPPGAYQVLAKPDGTRFYLLGNSATGALQSVNGTFTQFTTINGLPSTPTAMAMSPNGKFLVAGANEINIIDTDSNTLVGSNISVTGAVAGIAINRASTRAYVVSNTAFGSVVSTYDLISRQRVGNQLNLTGGAGGITLSPQGRLYVTAINRIFEIIPNDPNLALATGPQFGVDGGIGTAGVLGPLKFTPDGLTAYAINSSPATGGSIIKFTVSNRGVASWPPFPQTPPLFSDLIVAGSDRVFAYSAATTTLWDVTPAPFGAAESALGSLFNIHNVLAVTASNEVPTAKYLFLTVGTSTSATIYRIDLTTNTQSLQVLSSFSTNSIQFASIPLQQPGAFFLINNFQVVQPNAVSQPLIARVLDSANRPVFNVPVTFSNTNSNNPVGITTPTGITDSEGYVQTTVTAPGQGGVYTINVSAGGVSSVFTVSVPGDTGGGGGNGGGGGGGGGTPPVVTQVQKVSGDGQLMDEFSFTPFYALPTVKVTDLNGVPLANIPVSFTVTSGSAGIGVPATLTDENGLAATSVNTGQNQPGTIFAASVITASTQFGSVDFYITTYHVNQFDRSGAPDFLQLKPENSTIVDISGGSGQLLTDAISFRINSANSPQIGVPIPNIAIRISSADDASKPGPISCEGNSLSDAKGEAHCNVRLGCTVGATGIRVIVGEYRAFNGQVNIKPGTASSIKLITGDNQSASAGQLLPITLTAEVGDGCGRTVSGAKVTWTVVQGTASLEQTNSTSDFGGRVSTRVRLGSSAGQVKIEVVLDANNKYTFTANNNVVAGTLRLVSGDGQQAIVNTQFASPLLFELRDTSNNPIVNSPITFVTNGAGTVNPSSAITDAQGRASTTVTAGAASGPLTVTGSFSGFTATANLSVRPLGPVVVAASFTNAASDAVGLAVCGLGIVKGTGLAPGLTGVATGSGPVGPLSYTIAGLSMTFNGIPVPLQSVSNINNVQQVNFQTPCELSPGSATAIITVNGVSTTVTGVSILAAQPGIFTYAGPNNRIYGAVIRAADGSYVTPSNYLRRGEPYYLVVTGLGQTTPPLISNSAGTGLQNVNLPVIVGVNNAGVTTGRSFYLAGTIGVYLIEFQVPLNSLTGPDQPLVTGVTINGSVVFSNSVFLPGVQ